MGTTRFTCTATPISPSWVVCMRTGRMTGLLRPDISFYIGKTGNEPIDKNMTMKYWNLLIDLTKTAPLLPY